MNKNGYGCVLALWMVRGCRSFVCLCYCRVVASAGCVAYMRRYKDNDDDDDGNDVDIDDDGDNDGGTIMSFPPPPLF